MDASSSDRAYTPELGKGAKRPRTVIQPYAPSACNICRKARTKCKGSPVCERCARLGHECTRGPDHRKAITRHHEQNLRHQNEELQAQVAALTERLHLKDNEISQLRAQTGASSLHTLSPTASPLSGSQRLLLSPHTPNLEVSPLTDASVSDDNRSDKGKGAQAATSGAPCSESESDSSSESESDESEDEIINVEGKTNLFRVPGHINKTGITTPFRSRLGKRRTRSQRMLRFRWRGSSPECTERHVLFLPTMREEEKKSHCTCEVPCWARYLPQDISFSREAHDLLLERFFTFYGSWCLRVIPEYFLRDMYQYLHTSMPSPSPRTAHYSPFLHLAILSVATAFSDDPVIVNKDTRKKFADLCKSRIEDELGAPSLSAIQGLGLLGSYHSGLGQQTLGFVYFGMSSRISQALGLQADGSQWVEKGRMTQGDLFNRYWCYNMECAQDACWSLYVGREFGLPAGQKDPLDLVNLADPILDTQSWRQVGSNPPICRTFTTFLYSCTLLRLAEQIMSAMTKISHGDNGTELKLLIAEIDLQLLTWKENLPEELSINTNVSKKRWIPPHILMMHCAYWWLMILLHRPFYRRKKCGGQHNDFSVSRCNLAAKEILALVRLWRQTHETVRYAPLDFIQVVFASGTVYLLAAHQSLAMRTTRPAIAAHSDALEKVEEAIGILKELGQSWPGAFKIANIFRKLSDAQKQRMRIRLQYLQMRRLTGNNTEAMRSDSPIIAEQSSDMYPTNETGIHHHSPPLIVQPTSEVGILSLNSTLAYGVGNGNLEAGFGPESEYSGWPGDMLQVNGASLEMIPQEFPMDDVSVFDFTRTGWVMADGSSFAEQPFAVEVGDQAVHSNSLTFDFGDIFSNGQGDAGDRELFELIQMDFGM